MGDRNREHQEEERDEPWEEEQRNGLEVYRWQYKENEWRLGGSGANGRSDDQMGVEEVGRICTVDAGAGEEVEEVAGRTGADAGREDCYS